MKKLLAITGAILLVYLFVTVRMTPSTAVAGHDTAERTVYLVKEYEGYVAVSEGDQPPVKTATPVAALPKSDRSRLVEGILLYSKEELKALLEDLCS